MTPTEKNDIYKSIEENRFSLRDHITTDECGKIWVSSDVWDNITQDFLDHTQIVKLLNNNHSQIKTQKRMRDRHE